MITAERKAELNSIKENLTMSMLLTLTAGELSLMAFNDKGGVFKSRLKSLVLSGSLEQLAEIIDLFDGEPAFYFLEDLICAGKVPSMTEEQYWEYIGE